MSRFLILTATWIACSNVVLNAQERVAHDPAQVDASEQWPQWRGPLDTGVAPAANPPTEWSDSTNIRWKAEIPGRGHSTPIVWGQYIFLTTAIPVGPKLPPRASGRPGAHDNLPVDTKSQFVVIALDANSGDIRWKNVVREAVPVEGGHMTASLASASAVTDGQYVFAFFGSQGLYCLDFEGHVLWEKSFGQMHSKHGHGEGASPVLAGETLVINWDHEEQSFVVALDRHTGAELWRRTRSEVTSWSTPIVVTLGGEQQLIVAGTDRVRGYSLETGATLWECGGMSANIVATPVYQDGLLYVGSSYEKQYLMAIQLEGATGDITGTDHVVWSRTRGTPYVPSLLVTRGGLYFFTHYQNILNRVDPRTGRAAPGAMRLGQLTNIYASPVAAAGHVYITDLEGTTLVLTDDEVPRSVALNNLNERVNASVAIVGTKLFIRGEQHLYCIEADSTEADSIEVDSIEADSGNGT